VKIMHSGRIEPLGVVTLTSSGNAVNVGRSSGMLLRVDRSGAEEAQADATPARFALHERLADGFILRDVTRENTMR